MFLCLKCLLRVKTFLLSFAFFISSPKYSKCSVKLYWEEEIKECEAALSVNSNRRFESGQELHVFLDDLPIWSMLFWLPSIVLHKMGPCLLSRKDCKQQDWSWTDSHMWRTKCTNGPWYTTWSENSSACRNIWITLASP